jgi:hypothetical protein
MVALSISVDADPPAMLWIPDRARGSVELRSGIFLNLCPRRDGESTMLDIQRMTTRTGDVPLGTMLSTRLRPNQRVRILEPVVFDVEWILKTAKPIPD